MGEQTKMPVEDTDKAALWVSKKSHLQMKFAALKAGLTLTEATEQAVREWLDRREEERDG